MLYQVLQFWLSQSDNNSSHVVFIGKESLPTFSSQNWCNFLNKNLVNQLIPISVVMDHFQPAASIYKSKCMIYMLWLNQFSELLKDFVTLLMINFSIWIKSTFVTLWLFAYFTYLPWLLHKWVIQYFYPLFVVDIKLISRESQHAFLKTLITVNSWAQYF